jgi:hypothetical protein
MTSMITPPTTPPTTPEKAIINLNIPNPYAEKETVISNTGHCCSGCFYYIQKVFTIKLLYTCTYLPLSVFLIANILELNLTEFLNKRKYHITRKWKSVPILLCTLNMK